MRKIVLYVPSMTAGGAERVFVNLANEMSKQSGLEIYLATRFEGVNTKFVTDRVKIIDQKEISLYQFYKYLKELNPDIILSTSTSNVRSSILKFFLSTKTLFITRAPNIYYPWTSRFRKGFKVKLGSFLLKYAYKYSDGVISNSPDTEKSLVASGISNIIKTIGNPVFYRSDINNNPPKPEDVVFPYIVYVGSFKSQKRVDLLLQAYQKLLSKIDVNLVIVGDGVDNNNKEKAEIFIKENALQNKVFMVGRKSDLAGYYKYAKCFVLCSEYEGFGNVIVESMAYGTPVVCFDCPGGPNFILGNNQYGQMVKFGDTDQFADRVYDVITKKIEYKESELKERASAFSVESITNEYLDSIKSSYFKKYHVDF